MGKKKRLKEASRQAQASEEHTVSQSKGREKRSLPASKNPSRGASAGPLPLQRLDSWIEARWKWVFASIFALFLLVAIGLFDAYIVPMADDGNYVLEAMNLARHGIYPSFQSVLYNVLMVIPSALFGYDVLGFKLFSLLFAASGIYLFYKVFRDHLPASVVAFALFIYASNYAIQFYSSAVMSEAFFMTFQTIYLAIAFLLIKHFDSSDHSPSAGFLAWTGLVLLLFSISKNMQIISAFVIALYFALHGRWRPAAMIAGVFVAYRVVYSALIGILFGGSTVSSQFSTMLLKNFYDPTQGNETLWGLMLRYRENFHHHIANDLIRVLGFGPEGIPFEGNPLVTWIFAIGCLLLLYRAFRFKENQLFMLGLYLMVLMSVVFIALQTHWKQDRMILIFIPPLALFIAGMLHREASRSKTVWAHWAVISMMGLIGLAQLRHLPAKVEANRPKLHALLQGDEIGGYTTDWKNYHRMSNWAAENLPEGSRVGVRKSGTSIVFTRGAEIFENFYASTREQGDQVIADLQQKGVTHIMACSLRLNPYRAVEGQVIGTMYSYLRAIYAFDPQRITLVHTIGDAEPCYLYAIDTSEPTVR